MAVSLSISSIPALEGVTVCPTTDFARCTCGQIGHTFLPRGLGARNYSRDEKKGRSLDTNYERIIQRFSKQQPHQEDPTVCTAIGVHSNIQETMY